MLLAITPIPGGGTSYLAIKAVGVGVSLVGIALTYPLARALYPAAGSRSPPWRSPGPGAGS
jgi:hypothetical protein